MERTATPVAEPTASSNRNGVSQNRELLLGAEHLAFRNELKAYISREVTPVAEKMERDEAFPHDILKRMGALGYLGIPYPVEYGGRGGDYLSYAIAVEELSRVWGSLGIIVAAHTTLGTGPLYNYGPETLKRAWVPRLAKGEIIGAYGLTEPQAGSDSGATATTAVHEGDVFVVNGTKAWCTNVTHAACVTITSVTGRDEASGKNRITALFVPRDLPGITVTKHEDKLGLRASDTSVIVFDNVRVPASNVLGTEGQGFKIFMQTLDNGRISIAAMSLGLGQAALDEMLRFAHGELGLFKSLFDEQATLAAIADTATDVAAARQMVYTAARLKDLGLPHTQEAAMAKFFASEVAMRATDRALDVLGRGGLISHDCLASRAFRDIKLCTIGEGTSEVQRLVISRELLRAYAASQADHG
ncbi:MAG: acyl-CoA dehydrogenase [Proteobacteria bacterium]|nr:acyl-CoA dehydrogenase [Pseudomonadota bacterium]